MICAVKWCVCIPRVESTYCAVHQSDVRIHPALPTDPVQKVTRECSDCNGDRECSECSGEGVHVCEHGSCMHEHDCEACDGTGDCQSCGETDEDDEPIDFDVRYLAFVNDTGWRPPTTIEWPWD